MLRLIKDFQGRKGQAPLPRLNQKGQALILAYLVLIFLTIIVSVFFSKAVTENNLARRQRLTQEAIYLAEGGIEDAICKFSQAIANYDVAADIEIWPAQSEPPPDPLVPHTTIYSSFHNATVNSVIVRLESAERPVDVGGGASGSARNYEVTATLQHPLNSSIVVSLHQIVERRIIPAFQHAVFYENDLEILPGQNMTFSGRIHSNSDIYLGAESGAVLRVDSDYLHSAGNIYNKRKDDGSRMSGDVSIEITDSDPVAHDYMEKEGVYLDSDNPNWTTESQTRWQGTVKSTVHGVTKLTTPQVRSILPDGYYANQAYLKIENNTIKRGGVVLEQGVDVPADTITDSTTFYNNREDKTVKMTEVDLMKLAGYESKEKYEQGIRGFDNHLDNVGGFVNSNGLLYATRNDSGDLYQPGIRLVNGELIDRTAGLTMVTNDPLYVQGNYNTENKKSAAVICDSLNLLSSAWDNDADSHAGLDSRVAQETTVNTAFIAGIDDTVGSQYNGGLENYPRMHEKWSGINLNIRGGFLALWNSEIATGAWVYGYADSQYTAPIRNWDYDTDFNDTGNLPPFTPWAVEMYRVAWWKE